MPWHAISLLILSLLPGGQAQLAGKSASQRIGDLVLDLVAVDQQEAPPSTDHHPVAVRLRARNLGKQALCASFRATMKASFGLQYDGSVATSNQFRVHELLPGEQTEGDYKFSVKNGAEPIEIILKPTSESQTCVRGQDSWSSIWHNASEIKFDLRRATDDSMMEEKPLRSQAPTTAAIRAFLISANGKSAQAHTLRTFQDRCPQLTFTTLREAADYVLELTPSSLRHSKNTVLITNPKGDVVYTGETLNLGNAVKDACAAILADSRRAPKGAAP